MEPILKKIVGAKTAKEVKLQTMRRKYEVLQMEENEAIADYFTKILTLTKHMKSCGEVVKEQFVIENILRILTPKYDHIVMAIEESKELEDYKLEELQSYLDAHEYRLKERCQEKNEDHAFQAQSFKKSSGQWSKRKFDKRKVQGCNCGNHGHYATKCKSKRLLEKKDEEARLAQNGGSDDDDDDHYLLMATVKNNDESSDLWYLDTRCSNHMTHKREWLTILDESTKRKVKFVDHNAVSVEGIGKVMMQRKNGKKVCIFNVFYVPKMRSNLISLGKLLEKGYTMEMKDDMLKVFDKNKLNILKAPLSANRTFKIGIQITDQKCLQSTIENNTWLCHKRYGHLNFMSLDLLEKGGIVTDSSINADGDFVYMELLAEMELIDVEYALKQPHWIEAMEEELRSIERNNTWNDLLIIGENLKDISIFKQQMQVEFDMTDLGQLAYFLASTPEETESNTTDVLKDFV
ncbi:PREDICTED: uncharacterized protein LOC109363629 [Lupinus angustifolius]|uniref:uncharacterized protein LOC109363629 n=1 Tax=Lupinus angustifolius TaxID=3871 RepID=UPI00092E2EC3|nr:PREDICTED: uncharacterized protein LOC109363629 [Lupinus angustifolius]